MYTMRPGPLPLSALTAVCVLQVLGEPRAREVLPPQMTGEYVRKLLDVFRVFTALAHTPLHSKVLPH